MTKISRLITFGDSYTFGQELTDPATSSWPALIAKKYNLNLINYAQPGYSNDAIIENVVEHRYTSNDLVIICFSMINRFYFEDQQGWFVTIPSVKQDTYIRQEITKNLISIVSFSWLYKRYLNQIILLQNFLKNNNVNYLFCAANHNEIDLNFNNLKFTDLVNLIDTDLFFGWPHKTFEELTKSLPRGTCGHPLEEAHDVYAINLSKLISKLYIKI